MFHQTCPGPQGIKNVDTCNLYVFALCGCGPYSEVRVVRLVVSACLPLSVCHCCSGILRDSEGSYTLSVQMMKALYLLLHAVKGLCFGKNCNGTRCGFKKPHVGMCLLTHGYILSRVLIFSSCRRVTQTLRLTLINSTGYPSPSCNGKHTEVLDGTIYSFSIGSLLHAELI